MILTTHQPIFLPWPGFFYKALHADVMVLLDDVQFPLGRGWMTRNRLKCSQGELWFSVPVWRKGRGLQTIREVALFNEIAWRRKHLLSIRQSYTNAPYLGNYLPGVISAYTREHQRLLDFNVDLIRFLWNALGIKSRLLLQSEVGVAGNGTDLLISLCRALNADHYVTLPPVEKYLDEHTFQASGIELSFARFRPPMYPQLWGDFRYNLSALDMLLNCGPKSLEIIACSQ